MEGLLMLPGDIRVMPVDELPEEMRAQIGAEPGGYAISRPNLRVRSKVVDGAAWALLEQFRQPKTVVDAVLMQSRATRTKAEELFEQAYPLLEDLFQTNFLVEADSPDQAAIRTTLAPGDSVAGYEVIRNVQTLPDTELYQVRGHSGLAALKLERPGAPQFVAKCFTREAEVLRRLDGAACTPHLLGSGTQNGRCYLAIEWREGGDSTEAAARLRAKSQNAIARVCETMLNAYADLHEAGVLHGDVHPRNLLIAGEDQITLLDFGLAVLNGERGVRGGMPLFFEPEYATAVLDGQKAPRASERGEQYGVGALLYVLLAGVPYLDFAPERTEILRQIVQAEPVAFGMRGCSGHAAVELVLRRALQKHPGERWSSMREFAMEFAKASEEDRQAAQRAALLPRTPVAGFAGRVLDRTASPSRDLHWRGLKSPLASVTYGAAGVAAAIHAIAAARDDGELFARADAWAEFAASLAVEPNAFHEPSIRITRDSVGTSSPYHGEAGVHAVRALIAHARGDINSLDAAAGQFLECSQAQTNRIDLTLGRGSTLIALSLLTEAVGPRPSLIGFGNELLESVWDRLDSYASIDECKEVDYLGLAHGWAGFLYSSLRWANASGVAPYGGIRDRLEQLADFGDPGPNGGLLWPWSVSRPNEQMQGWCNGLAGFVFLWTLAHRTYGDSRYLDFARRTAVEVAAAPPAGFTLCCGAAGQAYALLNLFRHTQDDRWLHDARKLAELGVGEALKAEALGDAGMPLSLYKGDVGLAVLTEHLQCPERSAMPFFE